MTNRQPDIYNTVMPERWAERNGVRHDGQLRDDSVALSYVIDRRKDALVKKVKDLRGLEHEVFDHPNYFTKNGDKVVAVVTAPYLGIVQRYLGSTAALNAKAHEIAVDLGLFVRVGHPADTIYLTRFVNEPTIPIVWWNPDRIALDIPKVEDPYPIFAREV